MALGTLFGSLAFALALLTLLLLLWGRTRGSQFVNYLVMLAAIICGSIPFVVYASPDARVLLSVTSLVLAILAASRMLRLGHR